jgi:hypothetical protein
MSGWGHFRTKSEAASFRIHWSHPPAGADVLHLAFVLNNALGSPASFRVTAGCPSATAPHRSAWQKPPRPPALQSRTPRSRCYRGAGSTLAAQLIGRSQRYVRLRCSRGPAPSRRVTLRGAAPHAIGITTISAAWSGSRYRSGVVSVLIHACPTKGVSRRLPERYLFQLSLRSRCTAMLAGLRTLIQTRHGPDRYGPSIWPAAPIAAEPHRESATRPRSRTSSRANR